MEPMREIKVEATTAGGCRSPIDGRRDLPHIQILAIRQLLEAGEIPILPLLILSAYQHAERTADTKAVEQSEMFG